MAVPDNSSVNWSLWFKAFGLTFLGLAALSAVVYSQLAGAALSWGLIAAFALFSTGIAAKIATRFVANRRYRNPSF
jgi:hypothetical protein